VRVCLEGAHDAEDEKRLALLESAGHTVLEHKLKDAYDLGGQFFLWEAATAAAGFLLGVNPFDQPDVQAAKDRTGELLASLKKGALPAEKADLRAGGLAAFGDPDLRRRLAHKTSKDHPLRDVLASHLERLSPGDYCVFLAYLEPSEENRLLLEKAQRLARELTTCPVAFEWGPRYLHSTGQLHKGGSASGLFLMLTDAPAKSLPIPGRDYPFSTLVRAQARGDYSALLAAGRRVLRLDLGALQSGSLASLPNALSEIVSSRACPR
jgi:transaldolase/glucose-6-phosphate isomerase